ncbi:HYR domain-containing protein [Ancylomarina longa]|uniref:HYR domain-containing protein n=1 Tax=Ancylomarina longa TaxID=2487017 RepID=A0A434AVG1_9BACT|nr:HYR domain-containing protein [Ancylomarina longa]RUT78477.1 HYR domain-containing protein [Ancylomarina longa]
MTKHFYIKFFILVFLIFWLKVDLYAQTVLSASESVCAGELRSYRVEGFANSNIYWTVTGGVIINDGVSQGTSFNETTVISGLVYESVIQVQWSSAGSYVLTAREETPNSCVSGDLNLTVTVNALPDISSFGFTVSSLVCKNTSPSVIVTGLSPNTAYTIGFNDNGVSKLQNITTNASGDANLTVDIITSDATYNIESVAFNDGGTNCVANPAPSLLAKTALIDNVDPLVACVGNQTRSNDAGVCYYTASGTEFDLVSYSDNCTVASVTNDFNGGNSLNGAQFPKGTTTVAWTVTDNSGNTNTCSFDVIVSDNEDPVADVASLSDVVAQCSVSSLVAPTASDNCSAVTVTNDASLPINTQGTTVVTWTYKDAVGNSSTQTQNVVITDNTAPVADVASLSDVVAQCSVSSLVAPTASDNCSAVTVTNDASLPINTQGTTVVTWTYTDVVGNTSTQTQNVIVDDTTDPVLADLSDLSIDDCAQDETSIPQVKSFAGLDLPSGRYSDNCSSTFTVQYKIQLPDTSYANSYGSAALGASSAADPSGFEFPEGISTLYFRVLDQSGNISNEKTYTISVNHKPNPSEINY